MAKRQQDPYAVLGVARDADEQTIKRAYRELAQKHHPDRNSDDPEAEDRFKEVSAAYTLLSDPKRRKAFDEFGDVARDPNFDPEKFRRSHDPFGGRFRGARGAGGAAGQTFSSGAGFEDLGGIFGDLFGGQGARGMGGPGRSARRDMRGKDREAAIDLCLEDAARGCEQSLTIHRGTAGGVPARETLRVQVPAGVKDGAKIRLKGKGDEGRGGAPAGDLLCRVQLRPHRIFRREDSDLHLDVPISLGEALLGAEIEVPILDGRVTLSIPPETDGGTRMRLRGKGMPAPGNEDDGDLFVTLHIRVPRNLDDDAKKRVAELTDADPENLRKDLFR